MINTFIIFYYISDYILKLYLYIFNKLYFYNKENSINWRYESITIPTSVIFKFERKR